MIKKKIKDYTFLIIGIFSVILGIMVFYSGKKIISIAIYSVGIELIVTGIFNLIQTLFKHKKKEKILDLLIKASINIIFGIIIMTLFNYVIGSITVVFALYMLLVAITNTISLIVYIINDVKGKISLFVNAFTSLIFAIILIINPYLNIKYVLIILAIYIILYGIKNISSFIYEILPIKISKKIKEQIEVPLPVLITMLIPQTLLKKIIKMLLEEKKDTFDYKKLNQKPNLFVIIHLAKTGSASFGHIEVSYDGKTYSYGNYNKHNRKLFDAIGDGIILIADTKKYINYCVNKKNRYLIEFGLLLTKEEEDLVKKRIDKLINSNTTDFYPDLELYEKGLLPKKDYNDISSEVYKYANGSFKKILTGKNKVFFVAKNNCAVVAQYILGTSIITINGIISPGTYYDYLNRLFLMNNTNVITRKLYAKEELCQNYQK